MADKSHNGVQSDPSEVAPSDPSEVAAPLDVHVGAEGRLRTTTPPRCPDRLHAKSQVTANGFVTGRASRGRQVRRWVCEPLTGARHTFTLVVSDDRRSTPPQPGPLRPQHPQARMTPVGRPCSSRSECPRIRSGTRTSPTPDDSPVVAAWRIRTGTDEAKERHKDRAATAEFVNAIARDSGLERFGVGGPDKGRTIAFWVALAPPQPDANGGSPASGRRDLNPRRPPIGGGRSIEAFDRQSVNGQPTGTPAPEAIEGPVRRCQSSGQYRRE